MSAIPLRRAVLARPGIIGVSTARDWVARGKLPARRIGRRLFIDPADLDRLLAGTPVAAASSGAEAQP